MNPFERARRQRTLQFISDDVFNYGSLAANEIRLIEIFPGSDVADIECRIFHQSLTASDIPEYIALSYCWGNTVLDHEIHAPQIIPVTLSLHAALVRLRRDRETELPVLVWADAVCIDQENIPERNSQVLQMRHVYEKAAVVAVYLGEEAENSDLVYELITNFIEERERLGEWVKDKCSLVPDLRRSGRHSWQALRAFLRRPWFTRLWVIQEVVSTRWAIMLCGLWVVELRYLMELIAFVKEHSIFEDEDEDFESISSTSLGIQQIDLIGGIAAHLWEGERLPLLHLLVWCRPSRSQLPIDHLYAVLGISAESDEQDLAPDYGLSAAGAMKRYARFFLRNGWVWKMLSQVDSRTWMAELPTWVPNWWASNADFPWLETDRSAKPGSGTVVYCAGGETDQARIWEGSELRYLRLQGIFFDNITHVGQDQRMIGRHNFEVIKHYDDKCFKALTLRSWELLKIVSGGSAYDNLEDAIVGVLLAGLQPPQAAEQDLYHTAWRETHSVLNQLDRIKTSGQSEMVNASIDKEFVLRIAQIASSLRLCKTETGFVGQVPHGTEATDKIAIFDGSSVPFVLRPEAYSGAYKLIGACYVHGIMDGTFWTSSRESSGWITLV